MRKKIIIGNWKMNKPPSKAKILTKALSFAVPEDREVVICPPFVSLDVVKKMLKGRKIKLGAQNMYFEESGAYTGEISALMLSEMGVSHVLVGHSERRAIFHETNKEINKKLKIALEYKFTPVFCVGESLEEREGHMTEKVIERQLREGLDGLKKSDVLKMVIAYEPVWAIGSGQTATAKQAVEVHKHIRAFLSRLYDKELSEEIRIIYGGSVKPDNVDELMSKPDIDGVLPGGASLDAAKFTRIVGFKAK
ncbi:MAG: triose-phosphate isomerase [Nanoarchaeota archaeon]|nr:triose-phosphate isomerase [Nanoarchaeota archaeon]